MEAVSEAENGTLVFMTNSVVLYFKMLTKNLKGGYLTHLLGFEVTERIEEMEAVLEAENITLAFRNQYGCFIP